ncbi:MAG: molybdopterin cofactor-binding domain-containing protein [Gammaproteobacteria bacterium]
MSNLSRRAFIRKTGGSAAIMTLLFRVPGGNAESLLESNETKSVFRPNSRLSINSDGRITVHIEKAEMGQGVTTALAQIVAEELEADWQQVTATLNTYAIDDGFVITASSWTINTLFESVSRAAAAARLILVEQASEYFGVSQNQCLAISGHVRCGDKTISYGEIVALAPLVRTFSDVELKNIALKQPATYKTIGQPQPPDQQEKKLTGALKYGIDYQLPGMVYAKVAYPPSIGESHKSLDDTKSKKVPGYIATVTNEHVVAVVADSLTAATAARDALQIDWQKGVNSNVNSTELWEGFRDKLDKEDGRPWVKIGDAASALKTANQKFVREYSTELAAHLQMEPYNCTAEYKNGEIHLYCGTQYPTRLVQQVAKMCFLDKSKVFIHQQYMGGSFGALLETECQAHAAVIAKAVGKPVKLILSREEDLLNDKFRSPSLHKISCGVTEDRTIQGWEHRAVSAWPSSRHDIFLNKDGFDSFALSGSDHYYGIKDQHVRAIEHDLGTPVGYVRGVSCGYMFFAIESFLDELAHETDKDPLELRLSLLPTKSRLANVLKKVAEIGEWGTSLPSNVGLGLSAVTAQDSTSNTTRLASIARVRIDKDSGIQVEKLTCVIDCGIVVNPAGATAMAEGALLYGLNIALKGHGTIERGSIVERNFDKYPVLRMSDCPEINVEFINSQEYPTGMGEPAMSCAAPAVANAVYSAAGVRIRHLPLDNKIIRRAVNS